jgi:hypothetical protein
LEYFMTITKRCSLVVALLVFITSTPRLAVGEVQRKDDPPEFTLPFKLIDNRVFVTVQLNGRGPFHFILDTGAEADLSERAARQLGLKVEDAGEGQGVGAAKQHFGEAQIAKVQLGKLRLKDIEFAVISFADAPQVFGAEPVDGFIGRAVFEHMVVKHDYFHRRLTFTRPDVFNYSGSGTILPIERPRQIPVVEAKLDGIAGRFGVDTGARSALLLYRPFCEQNRLAEKYDAKLEGVTGWGIGGPIRSLIARAKELTLGAVTVRDPVIRLSVQKSGLTTSAAMAGLISSDILSKFDVTFDYARSRIILEKNRDYGRRDSYDRAGLWIGQSEKVFTVVDVIARGPADEAGVKAGDKILAIDGESTEMLVLPSVREKMRRLPAGNAIHLILATGRKTRAVTIKLRDLV